MFVLCHLNKWTNVFTSSVLYIPMPQPPAVKSNTSHSFGLLPSAGAKTILNLPGRSTTKSVALYCEIKHQTWWVTPFFGKFGNIKNATFSFFFFTWSPKACLPIVMACVQPGTRRGMFLQRIGSRKTVPPRMFLMVPFGLFHIFFRLNSEKNNKGFCWLKTPNSFSL